MHIHILGICGTFMGGIALLARELGHRVSGSDANVYPPMSTLLQANGIELMEGYQPSHLMPEPDVVVIGNALSRGNAAVEHVLNRNLRYTSGPQWLADHLLHERWVLAVAGTHGKTTTTTMLAWLLESAGLQPGFLIGGVAENFGTSARLGKSPFFVVEADEYDTAFFDKRSKFLHLPAAHGDTQQPRIRSRRHLPEPGSDTDAVPSPGANCPREGLIIHPAGDQALEQTLARGCWTPRATFGGGADWQARALSNDYTRFEVSLDGRVQGTVEWNVAGRHNAMNALAAIAAARHAGVEPATSIAALPVFTSVKRRMEKIAEIDGISVYDDFAHHPTAIAVTIEALRARIGASARIIAVLEPRSNTMKLGVHKQELAHALQEADQAMLLQPANLGWSLRDATSVLGARRRVFDSVDELIPAVAAIASPGDHVLIMSNGAFGGIYRRLPEALQHRPRDQGSA